MRLRAFISGICFAILLLPIVRAQVIRTDIGGGNSPAGLGGSVELMRGKISFKVGAGYLAGQPVFGGLLRLREKSTTWSLGDDTFKVDLPSDAFGAGALLHIRGLGLLRKSDSTRVFAFAGFTGIGVGKQTFQGEQSTSRLIAFDVRHKINEEISVESLNVFSKKATSIQSVRFSQSGWNTALAAGVGSGSKYFSSTAETDRSWLGLKLAYITSDRNFARISVAENNRAEMIGANGFMTLRPFQGVSISAGHQKFRDGPTGTAADVNNLSFSFSSRKVRLGGALFNSPDRNSGTSLWLGRRVGRVDGQLNWFSSRSGHKEYETVSATLRQQINSRLDLVQVIRNTAGQTSFSMGGHFLSNRFTVGLDYRTVYAPFKSADPFAQTLAIMLQTNLFGGVKLNSSTYVGKDGKIGYELAGRGTSYLAALDAAPGANSVSMGKYTIIGVLVDQTGSTVSGAALQIGQAVVYTNSEGTFSIQARSEKALPVSVLSDEFLNGEKVTVISCPETISPSLVPHLVKIVIRTNSRKNFGSALSPTPLRQSPEIPEVTLGKNPHGFGLGNVLSVLDGYRVGIASPEQPSEALSNVPQISRSSPKVVWNSESGGPIAWNGHEWFQVFRAQR